jgi:hypothetical protein
MDLENLVKELEAKQSIIHKKRAALHREEERIMDLKIKVYGMIRKKHEKRLKKS